MHSKYIDINVPCTYFIRLNCAVSEIKLSRLLLFYCKFTPKRHLIIIATSQINIYL